MKTKLKGTDTAHITLTVKKSGFKDVLTSSAPRNERGTDHSMKAALPHPRVRHIPTVGGQSGTLKVKRTGVTLCFTIKAENPKHKYYPLGIAFVRRNNRGRDNDEDDVLGRKNFSFGKMHLFGRSLYITDNFRDVGPADRYKFSVIIQREHDGAIGIIDPPVEHEN